MSEEVTRECPYKGEYITHSDIGRIWERLKCGERGLLCPGCREDRADARTNALASVILAGFALLRNDEFVYEEVNRTIERLKL